MDRALLKSLQTHLRELLDTSCEISPWKRRDELPYFVLELYEVVCTSILEMPCLLVLPRPGHLPTPAQLRKHFNLIGKVWEGPCVFVTADCPSYVRHRLIGLRIPFIVPGRQAYLPDLGIDLRRRATRPQPNRHFFSPSTQAVVLHALLHGNPSYTPSELSDALNYSRMTLTRALDELKLLGVGEVHRKGKERIWRWDQTRQKLWNQARPHMANPIQKRLWVEQTPCAPAAGLSALAHQSNLAEPPIPVFAMNTAQLQEQILTTTPLPDEAEAEVEIWRYDPSLFAKNQLVDPFSLYLSLKDDPDERTIAALDHVMENIE